MSNTDDSKRVSDAVRRASGRIADQSVGDLRRDLEGERSIGDYTLHEELGSGGAGTVYVAQDARHDRAVALKLFTSRDQRTRQRFQRELDAVGKLRHPNIVPLFDSGDSNGCLYMVMELIDGFSLAHHAERWLDSDPAEHPGIERMVSAVRDAARAIDYAHGEGILHRDLKPHNLLLDRYDQTHVTDFGLAIDLEEVDERITRSGAALGTPAYMAPEQATGKRERIDARTDVYALGATLFHALTGHTPFEHVSGSELFIAICTSTPPPPSSLNPLVPPPLDAVVLRCMEKEQELRYQSAAELADDLDRFLAGDSVLAESVGRLERARRAALRHPLITGLSLTVALLLVAFLVLLLRYEQLVERVEGR